MTPTTYRFGRFHLQPQTRQLQDGWTVVTADGAAAAHFEDTIVVTDAGGEILTTNARHGAG